MARVETELYKRLLWKESQVTHLVKPTFNRDYTSEKVAVDAWRLGATFQHVCPEGCKLEEQYVNDTVMEVQAPGHRVKILYCGGQQSVTYPPLPVVPNV